MIRVCSQIMGTGKSSAAITYMNEHPNERFIYVTPYLDEAARIKNSCPDLKFVEPSDKIRQYHFHKYEHTAALIEKGKNISTTHQAFRSYSVETLENIKRMGYTLIVDENLEMLEEFDFHKDDIQMAVDADYIYEKDGIYYLKNEEYGGRIFRDLFKFLKTRELIRIDRKDTSSLYYWVLPPALFTSFKDVFVLTYLFDGQSIRYFLDIYNIPYQMTGISRDDNGQFRFDDNGTYQPSYVTHIGDVLHILDNPKMNAIGDKYYALSKSWFEKEDAPIDTLKKHLHNYFTNINIDIPADKKLWGVFKDAYGVLRGKGYTKSFLAFNTRATNAYKDRYCLAYLSNIFMNVMEKQFYKMHGIEVDEDAFALSILVQWIWRSSIRDGEEIYLYIPSRRMRTLLQNWIKSLSESEVK